MARFQMELPAEIMRDFERLREDAPRIIGKMVEAGAQAAAENVRTNAPMSEIADGVRVTAPYRTPSDGGINAKVYVTGYVPFSGKRQEFVRRGRAGGEQYVSKKGVPAAFLAQVFEYGTSPRFTNSGAYRGFIGKIPFFRRSFKKQQIEAVMKKVQAAESGGLLDE